MVHVIEVIFPRGIEHFEDQCPFHLVQLGAIPCVVRVEHPLADAVVVERLELARIDLQSKLVFRPLREFAQDLFPPVLAVLRNRHVFGWRLAIGIGLIEILVGLLMSSPFTKNWRLDSLRRFSISFRGRSLTCSMGSVAWNRLLAQRMSPSRLYRSPPPPDLPP